MAPQDLTLKEMVEDFASALKAVDSSRPIGRSSKREYRPGVGPLTEDEAVVRAVDYLRLRSPQSSYATAAARVYPGGRQRCDLVVPNKWAIEFKLIRPFGDNGNEAEHWSENILHPYSGNVSSIVDCLKLLNSGFSERKAIIVFGYEHTPPVIRLETAVQAFELIAREVAGISLGPRHTAEFADLIHPVHQQGKVFGWELLPRATGGS